MLEAEVLNCPHISTKLSNFQWNSDVRGLPYLNEYEIGEQLTQSIKSRYFTLSKLASLSSNTLFLGYALRTKI